MNPTATMTSFRSRLPLSLAFRIYLGITAIALFYHVLILTQVVDYKNAWGGRLESLEQMRSFEAISIALQLVLAVIVWLKVQAKQNTRQYTITKVLVFLIAGLFLLNTAGNLVAIELFERVVFTPITLIASLTAFRIALE